MSLPPLQPPTSMPRFSTPLYFAAAYNTTTQTRSYRTILFSRKVFRIQSENFSGVSAAAAAAVCVRVLRHNNNLLNNNKHPAASAGEEMRRLCCSEPTPIAFVSEHAMRQGRI